MSAVLARLWPRSLTGRIVGAAAVALLVAQALNLAFLLHTREQQSLIQAVSFATARMIGATEPDARERRRDERRRSEGRRGEGRRGFRTPVVTHDLRVPPGFARLSDIEDRARVMFVQNGYSFAELRLFSGPVAALPAALDSAGRRGPRWRALRDRPAIREHLPPPPTRALLLSVQRSDGRWATTVSAIHARDPGVFARLIGQTLILYLAVLLPLAFVAHRISRPLRGLAAAVRHRDPAASQPPLAETGTDDVRRLIAAINGMDARVAALLAEKDVMLGAIGHDLKTPLAVLRVRIEGVDDDHERARMVASVDEIVHILDDILMLARLGRSGEASERTDLAALVATVVDEFSDGGGAVAMSDGDVGDVAVAVRPLLLRRALRNLIDNALNYGSRAEVSIARTDGAIAIRIADDGPGIPVDRIAAMFEPFARAEESRSRATGGTGLGLTIARAIARAHGGDVELANRPGGGLVATLTLTLPAGGQTPLGGGARGSEQ